MKKRGQITWEHRIGSQNRKIVVIGVSDSSAIKAITFSGAELPLVRTKQWELNWKFPFLHHVEYVVAIKQITTKNP